MLKPTTNFFGHITLQYVVLLVHVGGGGECQCNLYTQGLILCSRSYMVTTSGVNSIVFVVVGAF